MAFSLAPATCVTRNPLLPFRPLPGLRSGWSQTIAAVFWPQRGCLRADALHEIALPDGDRVVVAENRPARARRRRRAVIVVHGLTGSCQSKDAVRVGRKLLARGYTLLRLNLRNCGPGFGLARHLYHSGRSEDLRAVVQWQSGRSEEPVTVLGFSLGGNISLKMAGEDGARRSGRLDSVLAVSAPIDLRQSSLRLSRPENRFFDRYFTRALCSHVRCLHARIPDLAAVDFPPDMTVRQFDDLYTAPRSGFQNADDYYRRASSLPLIPAIEYRTLLVGAADDPVVETRCYRSLAAGSNLEVLVTEHGGHMGFLGTSPGTRGVRWMDSVILQWIECQH